METGETREVDFHMYCRKCKFYEKAEDDDPCNECLADAINFHSRKPIKFVEAMGGKNTKEGV